MCQTMVTRYFKKKRDILATSYFYLVSLRKQTSNPHLEVGVIVIHFSLSDALDRTCLLSMDCMFNGDTE